MDEYSAACNAKISVLADLVVNVAKQRYVASVEM